MASEFNDANLRRISDADLKIADGEPDVRGWDVRTATGDEFGEVRDLIVDTAAMKVRYLEVEPSTGRRHDASGSVLVPLDDAELDVERRQVVVARGTELNANQFDASDVSRRSISADTSDTDAVRARGTDEDVRRLTRAEEELRIGKRAVQTGEVRVGKHVETERVHEEVTLTRERVHVERRPVTDATAPAEIRASGEEIRVPIVEEEVVVEKRPVVKEELVISKERVQESAPVDAEVRREEFDVEQDHTRHDRDTSGRVRRDGGE